MYSKGILQHGIYAFKGPENSLLQGCSRTFAGAGEYFILSPAIPGSKCVGTGKKKRRRTQAATWPPRPVFSIHQHGNEIQKQFSTIENYDNSTNHVDNP